MNQFLLVGGVIAAQVPNLGDAFLPVLGDFDTIIEIGYHRGALSRWLNQNKAAATTLVCYDIDDSNREVFDQGLDFRIGDCFSQSTMTEIQGLITNGGKTLVLCDGGEKNREFATYAPLIKSGDVIMCHDYYDETKPEVYQTFAGANWWSPPESSLYGVQDAVDAAGLVPYNYDSFRSVIWGAFTKP